MSNTHIFSKREEIANSVIHGIGALLSVAALVILIVSAVMHGTAWHVVSFTLFGATMVILFVSSTLVHSFPAGRAKDVFEIMDHSSIYFFIAGAYTPLLFLAVKGPLGWTLFGIVWGLAIAGTVFKAFFVKRFLKYVDVTIHSNGLADCVWLESAGREYVDRRTSNACDSRVALYNWSGFLCVAWVYLSSCSVAFICARSVCVAFLCSDDFTTIIYNVIINFF